MIENQRFFGNKMLASTLFLLGILVMNSSVLIQNSYGTNLDGNNELYALNSIPLATSDTGLTEDNQLSTDQLYVESGAIQITTNAAFDTQAAAKGWDLGGTKDGTTFAKAYVLNWLNISDASNSAGLIFIKDTDRYFTIQNSIFANNKNGRGIYFINVKNGVVNTVTINNNAKEGILIETGSDKNTVVFCTISNNGYEGIKLTNSPGSIPTNNLISDNEIFGNERYGIYIGASAYTSVMNNDIHDNTKDGIYSLSSTDLYITGNTITSNNENGIYIRHNTETIDKSLIEDNAVNDNLLAGISQYKTLNNTLRANSLSNNSEGGIYLLNSGNQTIEDNVFVNNGLVFPVNAAIKYLTMGPVTNNTVNGRDLVYLLKTSGVIVPAGAGQVILVDSDNVKVNNQNLSSSSVGLYAWSSTGLYIHDNELSNNNYGMYLGYSGNNNITDNLLLNNKKDGIHIYYSSNSNITGNILNQNGERGIYLSSNSHNSNITQNTISDGGGYGINIYYSINVNMTGNTISNNDKSGVYLNAATDPIAEQNVFTNNGFDFESYTTSTTNMRFKSFINNVMNGNPIVYWVDKVGGVVPTTSQILFFNVTGVEIANKSLIGGSPGLFIADSNDLNVHDNTIANGGMIIINTENSTFADNTMSNGDEYGILLRNSHHNNFENTVLTNFKDRGIYMYQSNNNSFSSGTVTDVFYGIFVDKSHNNSLDNIVISNTDYGILVYSGSRHNITNNIITNVTRTGIKVYANSDFHNISGNSISHMHDGMYLEFSDNNIITNNHIYNAENNGIQIAQSSNNIFRGNSIINSINFALWITSTTSLNNVIEMNNFVETHQSTNSFEQVSDTSTASDSNSYDKNYWSDLAGASSYTIGGPAAMKDLNPLAKPTKDLHYITRPIFTSPVNGFYFINGTSGFSWTPSIDSKGHSVTYSVYYLSSYAAMWNTPMTLLASGLTDTSVDWNTANLENGYYYIRIIVVDAQGLYSQSKREFYVEIDTKPHQLGNLMITYPNSDNRLYNYINIQWMFDGQIDSWGHHLNYSIYRSIDNGTTWTVIVENISVTSYYWNSKSGLDSETNLFKVVALDPHDPLVNKEYITPLSFVIDNFQIPSPPSGFYSPNTQDIISFIDNNENKIQLQWSPGNMGGATFVTYRLYRSNDDGATFELLIETNSTSYEDTDIIIGNTYYYGITATNPEGESYMATLYISLIDTRTTTDPEQTTTDPGPGPGPSDDGDDPSGLPVDMVSILIALSVLSISARIISKRKKKINK